LRSCASWGGKSEPSTSLGGAGSVKKTYQVQGILEQFVGPVLIFHGPTQNLNIGKK